jgi:predicted metalloendopeptidase
LIDGFTPAQRFFIAYAMVWGESSRPDFERLLVTTDPHPLSRFRAQGVLSNMPQFEKAFSCKEGDPMVRPVEERCRIW